MTRHRLRSDLVVVEQTYRGEQSYIVKDPETHKYFRFRPVEVVVMQEFEGAKSAAEIAAALAEEGLPFSAAQVEAFARKLQQMGLLERSVAEKSVLMMERLRAERGRRLKRTHYAGSLLRMRFSVGDPDGFFDRWLPRLRFFFSRTFLAVSLALFVVYFAFFIAKWPEISAAIAAVYSPSVLTLQTVVVFWLTALTVITVHELGHGFTCKYFGGHVHEMGAMLIYFQPAFYCNVSDAWTFPELRARLWVTAAGSWIQLVLAAIACLVWWAVEPGTLVWEVALVVILIGGVTMIVANANPLIPLDGYYALSDYLETPNLRKRAFGYLGWLVRRHVLRLAAPPPTADDREKRIFLIYGALAIAYSVTLLLLVAGAALGWFSRTLGALGVAAFALLLWMALRARLRRAAGAVLTSLREHRVVLESPRRWRVAGGVALALLVLGLVIPWPITVHGTFRVAAPLDLLLTAPESAVVAQVYVAEGARVSPGTPLVRLRNLALEREALVLRRLTDSLAQRAAQARAGGGGGGGGQAERMQRLEAERTQHAARLAGLEARVAALTLRAAALGVVVTPRPEEAVGRSVRAGEAVLRLVEPESVELRVALERAGAPLVRPGQTAALMPYADLRRPLRAPVASVAAVAGADSARALEARVRVAAQGDALRPGVTGAAQIVVRRSSVLGALWWAVRKRVRSDLLL